MIKNYEINEETLVVLPIDKNTTKVIETNESYTIDKNAQKIISESCEYYGSSYEGRLKGTKGLTGINYKAPIIIEESSQLIFFPTSSPRLDSCTWLNLKKVIDYEKTKLGTLVEFQNGEKFELNISKTSFQNQIFRAAMLSQRLNDGKIRKK